MRGLGKGVSGKPYPRLCNASRPRLEPGTFRSQAVRLYRLHQARPSLHTICTHTKDISRHNYENDEANIERPLINRNNINMHTGCHKENEL